MFGFQTEWRDWGSSFFNYQETRKIIVLWTSTFYDLPVSGKEIMKCFHYHINPYLHFLPSLAWPLSELLLFQTQELFARKLVRAEGSRTQTHQSSQRTGLLIDTREQYVQQCPSRLWSHESLDDLTVLPTQNLPPRPHRTHQAIYLQPSHLGELFSGRIVHVGTVSP